MKKVLAVAAVLLAIVILVLGERDLNTLAEKRAVDLEKGLDGFIVHPGELLELLNNTSVKLNILDLRDENEFNLFRIANSQRMELAQLSTRRHGVSPDAIVVLVSNDEGRARAGFRLLRLQGHSRVYILQGGINNWLSVFGPHRLQLSPQCDDCRRYVFEAALGDRHPESLPDSRLISRLNFQRRIKVEPSKKRTSGSCG